MPWGSDGLFAAPEHGPVWQLAKERLRSDLLATVFVSSEVFEFVVWVHLENLALHLVRHLKCPDVFDPMLFPALVWYRNR